MKLKAFTLPELFCTILVVGVVAILFWQIVYTNYAKRSASSKVRKMHSFLKQVQVKARSDYTDWMDYYVSPDTITVRNFADKYFLPYVTYTKEETLGDGGIEVILNDASHIEIKKDNCMTFVYDINGIKPPNEDGRDKFYFAYCPKDDTTLVRAGDLIPYQARTMIDRTTAKQTCKVTPKFCTGFTVYDDFNFVNDYPHKIPGN